MFLTQPCEPQPQLRFEVALDIFVALHYMT